MVIAFSDQAQVMQTYTESRRTLRRQIEKIQPTARHEPARCAARCRRVGQPGNRRVCENDQAVDESLPATVYIFSDGGFQSVPDFSLGNLTPMFVPIGQTGAENVGIVAFSTDRNPEDPARMQAFCSVANFGSRRADGTAGTVLIRRIGGSGRIDRCRRDAKRLALRPARPGRGGAADW